MLGRWLSRKKTQPPITEIMPKQLKPTELLNAVGRDLVIKMKQDPDWVWALLNVTQPSTDDHHVVLFRVFDPYEASTRRITVKGYRALDEHPELILYHGWVNTKNNSAEVIDSRQQPPNLERTH